MTEHMIARCFSKTRHSAHARRFHARPSHAGSGAGWFLSAFLVGALAWAAVTIAAPAAWAQDAQVQGLVDRVERLQRELQTLQRTVYRGEPPPVEAAAPAAGGLNTTVAARLELRLSQLEAQIRDLTGQIEEAGHRQNLLRGQLDKLAADTDLRLRQLEQGAGAPNVSGLAADRGGSQVAGQGAGLGADQGAGGAMLGQPLGGATAGGVNVLGTVPAQDLEALQTERVEQAGQAAAAPGQQTAQAYTLQGGTTEEQYKSAFTLLSQANYAEAELALNAFVEAHPDDPLAGNAKYWLGETYYVRQDFQQAAITFAEAYQRYPDNNKAPDNLLKLGMSLAALGSEGDACGTFAELLKRYPNAAVTVQQRAKQERQRLGCK